MNIVKILALTVAGLVIMLFITFVAARFHDGPLAIIPGGPLVRGAMNATLVSSWDAERDTDTIEMQLVDDTTSRTTWFVVHEGKGYIPASLGFPPGKTWHQRADGSHAILRIRDTRFEVLLKKLDDEKTQAALVEIVKAKYGGGPPSDAGVWFFNTESVVPSQKQ